MLDSQTSRLVFLFDGTCGVCTRYVRWLRVRDKASRVLALPNQTPGLIERYALTREAVDYEVWAVDTCGCKYAGAAAINRVLRELGGRWVWFELLYQCPPFRWLEEHVYRIFARYRYLFAPFGTIPECEQPHIECINE